MTNKILKAILLLSFTLISGIVMAQPDNPPGPEIPIDGGLGIALAAGAAYGINKLRKRAGSHTEE